MHDPTSLEGLTNIGANLSEIGGIAAGGLLLLTCWIPAAFKLKGYCKKMAIVAGCSVVLGVIAPGLVDFASGLNQALALVIAWACAIPIGVVFVGTFLLPTLIAFRHENPLRFVVLVVNLVVIIPFNWLIAFVWAVWHAKKEAVVKVEAVEQTQG